MSHIDPKKWSALLHACNWWTKIAAVHSFHADQDVGRKEGTLGERVREGGKGGGGGG